MTQHTFSNISLNIGCIYLSIISIQDMVLLLYNNTGIAVFNCSTYSSCLISIYLDSLLTDSALKSAVFQISGRSLQIILALTLLYIPAKVLLFQYYIRHVQLSLFGILIHHLQEVNSSIEDIMQRTSDISIINLTIDIVLQLQYNTCLAIFNYSTHSCYSCQT